MLAYSLEAFNQTPEICTTWVGVSPSLMDSPLLAELSAQYLGVQFQASGGPTRQETVCNTLRLMLESGIPETDWVLVHDAARPGITPRLIEKLVAAVKAASEGGLLAIPVADTLKRTSPNSAVAGNLVRVETTVSRAQLWQAQTPQMFGLKVLYEALEQGILAGADITDEASAMELQGYKPLLIEGAIQNLKVTHPADWDLMQSLLLSQYKSDGSS